jgi:hypothetical protein
LIEPLVVAIEDMKRELTVFSLALAIVGFGGCRAAFQAIGLAESQYYFVDNAGRNSFRFPLAGSTYRLSVLLPAGKRWKWKDDPLHYTSHVSLPTLPSDSMEESFLIDV